MSKALLLLLALILNACVGAHIYAGAEDERLNDMTIVVHLSDFAGVQKCNRPVLPIVGWGYGRTRYITEPLPERFKSMPMDLWEEDRPTTGGLPLIKYDNNRVEMASCHVCSVIDKDIVWEEIVSRCTGGRGGMPFAF